ncbi:MAG: metallophosphoesterase family protein [Parcubacteria group bacterium]|jgi:hypothetical protein
MKIAIISDIHNNEVNLKKVLDYLRREKIATIICCGDLASQETLDFLNDNFSGVIHYTFGNMDNDQLTSFTCHPERSRELIHGEVEGSNSIRFLDKLGTTCVYKNTVVYKNFGETEIAGKQIAFVHYPEVAKKLCAVGKYAFVFYGHTHKPWEETIGDCKMLNPGNVAGELFLPTFAVWETKDDKFELIRIHALP